MPGESQDRLIADRYQLERELGRGGMGMVYLALDLKYDRRVAIKFFSANSNTGAESSRFLEEIRTAARLTHPHILPVHDSGEADGTLFYVMPRVDGRSLRERLEREQRLSVAEALRITRQVAEALGYAHANGVVHRDVKPENILLEAAGHAWVADFGLSRALTSIAATRHTAPGLTVGSPPYMSPEQVSGEADADSRSDLYSLGCVLFEMLVGAPPFSGGRAHDVMRRHLVDPPPSARARRADVPPALERILECLLAKDPDDRYDSADEVVAAIDRIAERGRATLAAVDDVSTAHVRAPAWREPRRFALGAVVVIVAAASTWFWRADLVGLSIAGTPPDTTRFAILPFRSGTTAGSSHHLRLREAFARWDEVSVVDPMQTADAIARRGDSADLDPDAASLVARDLGAGRFVRGSELRIGDSIQLNAALFDGRGRSLRSASVMASAAAPVPGDLYAVLADSLIFGRAIIAAAPPAAIGTRSVRSRAAYELGHAALAEWDLVRADSLFAAAVRADAQFARAHLWLAQTRNWLNRSSEHWVNSAEIAARAGDQLAERERSLAAGLAALARRDYPGACAHYSAVRQLDGRDFAALHGLGQCHTKDAAVVPDETSPSRYRFRSSFEAGVQAYAQAYRVLPSAHRAARAGGLDRLRAGLYTGALDMRLGHHVGSSGVDFLAHPALAGDTLAFVPWPSAQWQVRQDIESWKRAVTRQRGMLVGVTSAWIAAYPESADAAWAHAIALDLLYDPASARWMRRARALDPGPLSLQLAAGQIWMELRYGAPDTARIAAARSLADSVLALDWSDDPLAARTLAPIATAFGRPSYAALMASTIHDPQLPAAVAAPAAALLAYASVAAPVESIAAYQRLTLDAIRQAVPAADRRRVRGDQLELPALLAFPAIILDPLRVDSMRTAVGAAQAAWLAGDSAALLPLLEDLRVLPDAAGEATPETHYTKARILAMTGDTASAIAWLDGVLESLRWFSPDTFDRPGDAGAIGRAMALRARLAQRRGDEQTARRWANALAALWANAEPPLDRYARRILNDL